MRRQRTAWQPDSGAIRKSFSTVQSTAELGGDAPFGSGSETGAANVRRAVAQSAAGKEAGQLREPQRQRQSPQSESEPDQAERRGPSSVRWSCHFRRRQEDQGNPRRAAHRSSTRSEHANLTRRDRCGRLVGAAQKIRDPIQPHDSATQRGHARAKRMRTTTPKREGKPSRMMQSSG